MDSSALLAHIVSQTRQNVEFLISQRQISPADGRDIMAKLPIASDRSIVALEQQTQNLLITPPPSLPQTPAAAQPVQAKALWGFNENGQNSQDLSFRAGDIIEIVHESNSDWWTGRLHGREGVFPANYVEKLASPPPLSYDSRDTYSSNVPSVPSFPNQPSYEPAYQSSASPPAAYRGEYQPPAGGYQQGYQAPAPYSAPSGPPQPYNPYMPAQNMYNTPPPLAPKPSPAPAADNQAQQAAPPPGSPKKSKFGKYGSIVGQSAAGGLGFGAGSAVGSGIINSIF
ncbi:SH3-domain-containing protein [Favolaschia claudopus]|uniref:SH3-domain-containing protein n=1 Tax=Favolaschia claudopus TaxID=2862362 RepID=A0AAW0C105_9AGAR